MYGPLILAPGSISAPQAAGELFGTQQLHIIL